MYLKRLEIQGFKSFANKTVFEFERGITAVVGPNGSGKSNIADAIRWVLGEQSYKQLRGKKSEDVIFAGSDRKSRMSMVEVSVTFDNDDRKIALDAPEVSITRRMDRSGEGEYLINGAKVRLLDIVDLVLKSNIGTSRYSVIGQGTIDQMILSGPQAVKDLIDEASGVKTYYIRREKSLKRLETTTQNLIRVQDLLAEIEPRLKSLRRQAKRMQERSTIEAELRSYQREFYAERYWGLRDHLSQFEEQLARVGAGRAELVQAREQERGHLDKSEGDNRQEVQEYQRIQQDVRQLNEKKNKLIEDVSMVRGKLQAEKNIGADATVTDAKSLDLEKSSLENQVHSLRSQLEQNHQAAGTVDQQLSAQRETFEKITAQLVEVQRALDNPDHVDFEQLATDVEDLDTRFQDFYGSLVTASDVGAALRGADAFKHSLGEFKERTLELARNPLGSFEKQRHALNAVLAQKDQVNAELSRLDLEKSKVKINREFLERELTKVQQKLLQVDLDLQQASAVDKDVYFGQLLSQEQDLSREITGLSSALADLEQRLAQYHASEESRKSAVLESERKYRSLQDQLSKIRDQESAVQVEKARFDTQMEALGHDALAALGQELLQGIERERAFQQLPDAEAKIARLKNQLEMIGGMDDLTVKEYEETEQRFSYLTAQVGDLQHGMADLRSVIEELDRYIKVQFQDAFTGIDEKFQNYFRILFNGGRAYLSSMKASEEKATPQDGEDADDEESGTSDKNVRQEEKVLAKYEQAPSDIMGLDIKATPPGKKLSSISALSGGERALTSIALLCALLSCFPSPFVVLDEVDAALDEANTIRFAEILGTLASQTQFVTVSHNRETMRKAHTLYGITMGDDSVSKVISLKIDQAQAYAK